jgi:UDP-N-acetylmuramate: L-alanyl-gamma-D-glutamyl-meso-diaminopimelate ligase
MITPTARFYFIGIGGIGMTSVAGFLAALGHQVAGSDTHIYPPARDILERNFIEVYSGFSSKRLRSLSPDYFVVGGIVGRAENEEFDYARESGIPMLSFPEVINRFIAKNRRQIVVVGTHGKTTTSGLIAESLNRCGLPTSFIVGGELLSYESSFLCDKDSNFIVLEGDEYLSSPTDPSPKFLHYSPSVLVMNNVELDHVDMYRDLQSLKSAYKRLLARLNEDAIVIANAGDQTVRELCQITRHAVYYSVGEELNVEYRADDITSTENHMASKFKLFRQSGMEAGHPLMFETPLIGDFNISNAVAAIAVLDHLGCRSEAIQNALAKFGRIRRRLQIVSRRRGITIYDDFAHHPTAVRLTLAALKRQLNPRRLLVVFEPSTSSSRRKAFKRAYGSSFADATVVIISDIKEENRIPAEDRITASELADEIGDKAMHVRGRAEILKVLMRLAGPGDHVVFMSSGDFDGLPGIFAESLG